jgi:hypothetical protein
VRAQGEPFPVADVAVLAPTWEGEPRDPVLMWRGVDPVQVRIWQG